MKMTAHPAFDTYDDRTTAPIPFEHQRPPFRLRASRRAHRRRGSARLRGYRALCACRADRRGAKFDAVFLADNASIADQIDFRPITALEPTVLLENTSKLTPKIPQRMAFSLASIGSALPEHRNKLPSAISLAFAVVRAPIGLIASLLSRIKGHAERAGRINGHQEHR
jgi:hypothetical protein